jgi:hypothetical protein
MQEQTLFQAGAVQVTNARFVVGTTTYAIRNITSTSLSSKPKPMGATILFGLLTGGALLAQAWIVAAVLGLIAFVCFKGAHALHSVRLKTSGGEVTAIEDKDETLIRNIVDALNQSIVGQHI